MLELFAILLCNFSKHSELYIFAYHVVFSITRYFNLGHIVQKL